MSKDRSFEEVVSATALAELASGASQPAGLSNLAYANVIATSNLGSQNAVANQQALAQIRLALTGKSVRNIGGTGPLAAASAVDVLTSNELAQLLAELRAVLDIHGPGSRLGPGIQYVLADDPIDLLVPGVDDPDAVEVERRPLPGGGIELVIRTRK
jgi:hypothetical protein